MHLPTDPLSASPTERRARKAGPVYDPCVSARWRTRLTPENAVFIIVSFEGPDPYSQAGGLGVRVSGLANALADGGYETHLFFIGDPELAGEERRGSRLVLHRWAQWLSAGCPRGVYDGEFGKVDDVNRALPPYVIQRVVGPALLAQKIPIFLFEEWQTAECACRVSDALCHAGLRDRALLAWNANHCYGFERIAWPRLSSSTMITTVSRHMRSIVRSCGADARVIANGIPSTALDPAPRQETAAIRAALAVGAYERASAAIPATIGAAKEVPQAVRAKAPPSSVVETQPGAATRTHHAPWFEKL